MNIQRLELKNFRCFNQLQIDFDRRCTVIAGINGSGKSTILDALAISIGAYFAKIPTAFVPPINKDDALRKTFAMGSVIDAQSQFPVVVSSCGEINGKVVEWERNLNGYKNRTTVKNAKQLIDEGGANQKAIQVGDEKIVLPIIAYYDTGRLFKKKVNKSNLGEKKSSRLDGYMDALSSGTNEKLLFRWFEHMTLIELEGQRTLPELETVKKAMVKCFETGNPDVENVNIKYSVRSKEIEISYKKSDGKIEILPLHMFSDGIRITLTMVADIASRMARLNPQLLSDILETPGIVIIDEIDMHLHPSWQSKIISSLLETFPKVQFVTTTHSPIVIVNTKSEYLRLLQNGDIYATDRSYGRDIRDILQEIMGTDYRPQEITKLITDIHNNIETENLSRAQLLLDKLKITIGEYDAEVIAASAALELEQFFGEL